MEPPKKKQKVKYDFDLCVIGGGSGGIACAKKASDLGKKVCLLDFVKKSPFGTSWGLGGTCVNVGCIPKKLYHTAGIIGDMFKLSKSFGWKTVPDEFKKSEHHSWGTLRQNIVNHIRSLNFKYRATLMEKNIKYINAYGTFVDDNKIKCVDEDGKEEFVTAEKFVLAMGGRPRYPDIPGKELGISSDDIFHLEKDPGKTLLVGASYIALETAGFLNALGKDVSVMVRSLVLRGFDRTCAQKIKDNLILHGVKFLQPCSPEKFEKLENGKIKVYSKCNTTLKKNEEQIFDTVIFAIGRIPQTQNLGLERFKVKFNVMSKIVVNEFEQVVTEDGPSKQLYAVGDIIDHQELTPVAIQTGTLLAERLFGNSKVTMDYTNVATTVFTPLEYGCIGLSEEDAVQKYGSEYIDVYVNDANILEYSLDYNFTGIQQFFKIVVFKIGQKVVGFHYLGPNAGEVTQAFAVAMKCGVTKDQLNMTVGIHPTCAEKCTTMYEKTVKDSGC